jgi:hypothetical protein
LIIAFDGRRDRSVERAPSREEHGGEGAAMRDQGQATITGRDRGQATAAGRDCGQG